jgi:HlyD family secretion protein
LDNFPDSEFGLLRGVVQNISLVPTASGGANFYVVEMDLPEGLNTNYKKELPSLPNMTGIADIITEDMSLLERFVMPMKKIFKEGYAVTSN